jgi:glycine/D-amino acid oxidase-like deaminating enzyme
MTKSAIVIGSGAGGSVAAWELARAGHEVLVLVVVAIGNQPPVDHPAAPHLSATAG